MGLGTFSIDNHLLVLREERRDGQKNWDEVNDSKLKSLFWDLDGTNHQIILRAKSKGDWLNA